MLKIILFIPWSNLWIAETGPRRKEQKREWMGEWATHHDNFDQSEEPITPTPLHQHFPTVQTEPNLEHTIAFISF